MTPPSSSAGWRASSSSPSAAKPKPCVRDRQSTSPPTLRTRSRIFRDARCMLCACARRRGRKNSLWRLATGWRAARRRGPGSTGLKWRSGSRRPRPLLRNTARNCCYPERRRRRSGACFPSRDGRGGRGPANLDPPSRGKRDARNPRTFGDELILRLHIARDRVRRPKLLVVEIFSARPRQWIVADRQPDLGQMRLAHIAGRGGSAHLGRDPAGLERVRQDVPPEPRDREGDEQVAKRCAQ